MVNGQWSFLSKVLAYGQTEELLDEVQLAHIKDKDVFMSLKLADKFYFCIVIRFIIPGCFTSKASPVVE